MHNKNKCVVEYQKTTANHKKRYLKLMILVLFYIKESTRVWIYWNYFLDKHLNSVGPICFPPSWFPLWECHQRWMQWLLDWWRATFFVYRNARQLLSFTEMTDTIFFCLHVKETFLGGKYRFSTVYIRAGEKLN